MAEKDQGEQMDVSHDTDEEGEEETDEERDERQIFFRLLHQMIQIGPAEMGGGGLTNAKMIERLKRSGTLTSPAVENALTVIPRGEFVTDDLQDVAYIDSPQRFSKMGFNISAPHMYAVCLDKLNIEPGNAVLDIGSGCGHLTCIAGYLAGPTGLAHGLDIHQHIVDFANKNLEKFTQKHPEVDLSNVKFFNRNCFIPDVDDTLYDRIHVGACVPESKLPGLMELLRPGGILVGPYGDRLLKATKSGGGEIEEETLMQVRYSDLILPSEAEIRQAKLQVRRARAMRIVVPPSRFLAELSAAGLDVQNLPPPDTKFVFDDGTEVLANKLVLGARSEVFRAMFSNGMKEQTSPIIRIQDHDSNAFDQIVSYCSTDVCPALSIGGPDVCVSILELANYYKLENLIAKCELQLVSYLDFENAAQLLTVAERLSATQLRGAVLEYIYTNIKDIIQTTSFQQLDKDIMNMILLESVQRFHGIV